MPMQPDFSSLPEILRPDAERAWERFVDAAGQEGVEALQALGVLEQIPRVFAISEFVAQSLTQWPEVLGEWCEEGGLDARRQREILVRRLRRTLGGIEEEAAVMSALRRFRRTEAARIAIRDLTGRMGLETSLNELSALADACILTATEWAEARLVERYGEPVDASGHRQHLIVLAMGKLGGEELNFSSDIDLIFCFPAAGETRGPKVVDNEAFFIRLGQQLIKLLDTVTEDGFVYRVDTRLRPFGESGPLALSFAAMEAYYQAHGREWERYAAIKVRALGRDAVAVAEVENLLGPFVFRRYLDFSVFEGLRAMKRMIDQEVRRAGVADDIKLGPGGIREIEFIAQVFQLIRGGREPALRSRRLLVVLRRLAERGIISTEVAAGLDADYRFLRQLENRLQSIADQQVHALPTDGADRMRLAMAMGYGDWESLSEVVAGHREHVAARFQDIVVLPPQRVDTEADDAPLADVWAGTVSDETVREVLESLGYARPEDAAQSLARLRDSRAARHGDTATRRRLDALAPHLIRVAAREAPGDPETALNRLVRILEAIGRRSAYLALLEENPATLDRLARLCGRSEWITRQVAAHPLLLDELLDPRLVYELPDRVSLSREMEDRLRLVDPEDTEGQMEALRQSKQSAVFRVAVADLTDRLPVMAVSDHLTRVAEQILERVLGIARRALVARHGEPLHPGPGQRRARFLIVGYGKLGGMELGYGSDLDLVFLHDADDPEAGTDGPRPVDCGRFFLRLGQRIIHLLSTPTHTGELYEVDMRLRPSGRSGLLVSSLSAFEQYQRDSAWTWERQALLRSRPVVGDPELAADFRALRRALLCQVRDREELAREVLDMRQRMRSETRAEERESLRQRHGGLLDLEFLVQFQVLAAAAEHPEVVEHSDLIRQVEALTAAGVVDAEVGERLSEAYRRFRIYQHRIDLVGAAEDVGDLEGHVSAVAALWDSSFGEGG